MVDGQRAFLSGRFGEALLTVGTLVCGRARIDGLVLGEGGKREKESQRECVSGFHGRRDLLFCGIFPFPLRSHGDLLTHGMRTSLKWLGFALVAAGIAVFPFAIWFPGPRGGVSLLSIMAGCVVLLLVLKRSPVDRDEDVSRG